MFWVGVSLLVMSLTGLGDDSRAFLRFWAALEKIALEEIREPARQAEVSQAFQATEARFRAQRETMKKVGDCIEKVDRRYDVKAQDYQSCAELGAHAMEHSAGVLITSRSRFRKATTDEERAKIRARMLSQ